MDLLIHVGLHKTGTTSVQNHLFQCRECLLKESILYPETGIYGFQHALIPGSLIHNHYFLDRASRSLNPEQYIQQLNEEANRTNPKLAILSSEVFSEITQNRDTCLDLIKNISKCFSNCTIFISTRRAQELALSALKHSLRERMILSTQNPLGTYIKVFTNVQSLVGFWHNSGLPVLEKSINDCSSKNLTDYYFGEIISSYSKESRQCISISSQDNNSNVSARLNSDNLQPYIYAILLLIGNTNKNFSYTNYPIFANIAKKISSGENTKDMASSVTTNHLQSYLEYLRLHTDATLNDSMLILSTEEKIKALTYANVPTATIDILTSTAHEILQSLQHN